MFKFPCDADFIDRFKAGERSALETVYWAYVGEVEAFVARARRARSCTVSSELAAAELADVVQEIFLRAFGEKARRAVDGRRDYGPYLGALARNLTLDWTRRRRPEVHLAPEELAAVAGADTDWTDAATEHAVDEYIAGLSPALRDVHERRYVRCQTQEKVCADLGITRQQLRTREKHLRDGLQRKLARVHDEQSPEPLKSAVLALHPETKVHSR